MEAYQSFARLYDMFMDNVDYQTWSEMIVKLLKENNINEGQIVDLGCGTGNVTELLSDSGYEMIGIDNSPEMLDIAMGKQAKKKRNISYVLQDMRRIKLHGKVDAFVSVCDSMNYILTEEDLLKVFTRIGDYLESDGVFIFDLNTIYKYQEVMGESTFAESRKEGSFIWDNFYDEDEQINEYDLIFFAPSETDGLYQKFEETHYQRGYELKEVKALLKKAGFSNLEMYDAFTFDKPKKNSERVCIVAKK